METVDHMDEVRNKVSCYVGTINAIYEIGGIQYVDVKCGYRIYYKSPLANWEVVSKCDE